MVMSLNFPASGLPEISDRSTLADVFCALIIENLAKKGVKLEMEIELGFLNSRLFTRLKYKRAKSEATW